jgi:ABC-type nitrate/sulfonate/bicarbonate transport system permease component
MKKTLARYAIGIVGLILLVQILFWLGIRFPAQPAPIDVLIEWFTLLFSGAILPDILASSVRVLAGLGLATIVGVGLGVLLAELPRAGQYIRPVVEVIRPIPPIAWIPIAILTFGIGNESAYFIVFLGAFFPIFTNTYFGVRSLPRVLKNVSNSYGIKGLRYFFRVLMPHTLPSIFTGLRIAIGMGWMSVVAAELAGVQGGLGYFIQYSRLLLRIDDVIAGMLFIGVMGTLFVAGLYLIERVVMPWQKK